MISKEEVLSLAELARLKLDAKETESLQKDISSILEYVGQVSAAGGNTSTKAEELPPAVRNIMRADIPRGAEHILNNKEEAVKAAFPAREGEYNVVRKIIQKDE